MKIEIYKNVEGLPLQGTLTEQDGKLVSDSDASAVQFALGLSTRYETLTDFYRYLSQASSSSLTYVILDDENLRVYVDGEGFLHPYPID